MKDEQEQIILTFFKGRQDRIIAKNHKGKICLLDFAYCRENHIYVKENEDWRCAIKEERANAIFVQPITRTLTAAENEQIYGKKLEGLKDKFVVKKESPDKRKTSNR
jgi:hypothetical protein